MPRSHPKFRAVLVLTAGLLAAGTVSAATVSECVGDVSVAKADITAATTFVNAKDQTGLAGKADSAMQKLDKGKFADASLILADMAAKVTSLVSATKPKLGAEDGALISADIGVASTCVTQLLTQ
ncbi:MAG TPA: hypothetical protein VFV55_11050 [Usitatibacteraceae bacterium]|nr:hypothetical protein [Usitatibacteraceae bacterium]